MTKVRAKFRPSINTSWGSWQTIEGDWDPQSGVLWIDGKRGIHITTRTELEVVEEQKAQPTKRVA